MERIEVGSSVCFGNYPQNDGMTPEPIEWRIVDAKNDSLLLLSVKALDSKPYNVTLSNVTWENCTLRHWLNTDFLMRAFSSKEQKNICSTLNQNASNLDPLRISFFGMVSGRGTSVPGGNETLDKVFLLSWDECEKYFHRETNAEGSMNFVRAQVAMFHPTNLDVVARVYSDIERVPTQYAVNQGLDMRTGKCALWLRSPGNTSQMAVITEFGKIVYRPGCEVNDASNAVCPAIWVKKSQFLSDEEKDRMERKKCQYCGGDFKGLFHKKCVLCGKPKNY